MTWRDGIGARVKTTIMVACKLALETELEVLLPPPARHGSILAFRSCSVHSESDQRIKEDSQASASKFFYRHCYFTNCSILDKYSLRRKQVTTGMLDLMFTYAYAVLSFYQSTSRYFRRAISRSLLCLVISCGNSLAAKSNPFWKWGRIGIHSQYSWKANFSVWESLSLREIVLLKRLKRQILTPRQLIYQLRAK